MWRCVVILSDSYVFFNSVLTSEKQDAYVIQVWIGYKLKLPRWMFSGMQNKYWYGNVILKVTSRWTSLHQSSNLRIHLRWHDDDYNFILRSPQEVTLTCSSCVLSLALSLFLIGSPNFCRLWIIFRRNSGSSGRLRLPPALSRRSRSEVARS